MAPTSPDRLNANLPKKFSSIKLENTARASSIDRSVILPSMIRHFNDTQSCSLPRAEQFCLSSIYQSNDADIYHNRLLNPLQMQTICKSTYPNYNNNLCFVPLPTFAHLNTQNLFTIVQANSPQAVPIPKSYTADAREQNPFDSNIYEYYEKFVADVQQLGSPCHSYHHRVLNRTSVSPLVSPDRLQDDRLSCKKLPPLSPEEAATASKDLMSPIPRSSSSIPPTIDSGHRASKEYDTTQALNSNHQSAVDSMTLEELTSGSTMVCSEIQGHTNGCMFVAFSQMKPCKVTEEDLIGKNKNLKIGMPGICCKHCGGSPGCGRFFPSTFNSFVNGTNPDRVLAHVGHICIHTPSNIRHAIHELERQENVKPTSLRYGSRKSFFWYIWSKFQSVSIDSQCEESSAGSKKHASTATSGSRSENLAKQKAAKNENELSQVDSPKRKRPRMDDENQKEKMK
jgi:hypothetical protein